MVFSGFVPANNNKDYAATANVTSFDAQNSFQQEDVLREYFGESYASNYAISMSLANSVSDRYRITSTTVDEHFSGRWIDAEGRLNVGVTSGMRTTGRISGVVYNEHRFSYELLSTVHEEASSLMQYYSIHGVSIKPQYNRVEIELSDEAEILSIIRYLSQLADFEESAVNFIVEENTSVMESRRIHSGRTVARNLIDGGTLGAKATCNITGARGVLTNQHVAPLNTEIRYEGPWPWDHVIGRTSRAHFGGRIDAAFIPFNNPGDWQFTSSAAHGNTVIDTTYLLQEASILVGMPVAQFGQSSGRTPGRIISTTHSFFCGTTGVPFNNYIRSTYNSTFGDSGGPVFAIGLNKYALIGLHSHGGGRASNIWNIKRDLQVTVQAPIYDGPELWHQPVWISNTTTDDGQYHGTITASGSDSPQLPYGAFDGWLGTRSDGNSAGFPAAQWTKRSTWGWLQLELDYFIYVHSIEFYNRWSNTWHRTRDAFFTGTNGVSLGAPFTAVNQNWGRSVIHVGGVATDKIVLNITSSYGNDIGANEIIIHGTKAAPRYNVRFEHNNSVTTRLVVEGETAVFPLPNNPRKLGHIFMGWSLDGINVINLQAHPIFQHTTLIAVFSQGNFKTVWTGNVAVKSIFSTTGSVNLKALSSECLEDKEIRITYVVWTALLTVGAGDFIVRNTPFETTMNASPIRLTITVNNSFILTCSDTGAAGLAGFRITKIEVR